MVPLRIEPESFASYTVKTPVLKLTPAGVNTGPISNGVNLTPFGVISTLFGVFHLPLVLFQHRKVLKEHQNGVKLTPLEIGPVLTPAGVNLTPEFLQCRCIPIPLDHGWIGCR